MIKHYIKFAIRNFRANKVIFAGSLLTLCLGALCISLLFSYVHNELTMDNFHKRGRDIFMVIMKTSPKSEWQSPFKFTPEEYPEIENATSLIFFNEDQTKVKYNQNIYTPVGVVADSTFFKVFDFKLKEGNPATILNNPQTIILSEEFSKKIFGNRNPIGQNVEFEILMYQGIHTVNGIVEIPSNSSLKFDYIIPKAKEYYGPMSIPFFKAKKALNKNEFIEKIKNSNNKVPNFNPQLTESITSIIGLDELYFNSEISSLKKFLPFKAGNKKNVEMLIIIMLIILLMSILNYSNLQIINVNSVIKDIAVSKVYGASKKHIIMQKLIEILVIISVSSLLITICYKTILPHFNTFVKVLLTPPVWKIFLLNLIIITIINLLGLIYPIIIINRISTIKNLKNTALISQKIGGMNSMVIFQYSLTFILLISAFIVNNQLSLLLNKDLGFNKEGILKVKLFYEPPFNPECRSWSKERIIQEFEKSQKIPAYINNELASFSSIENFSQGKSPIDVSSMDWKTEGEDFEYEAINSLVVTPGFNDILNFQTTEGRFFELGIDQERGNKIVVNEATLKFWNIKNISNTRIFNRNWKTKNGKGYEIIGVVKDFNYEHLSSKPKPLIMVYFEDAEAEYFIKLHENKIQEGIRLIEELFKEINPNQTFKYSFLSDEIAALYQKEKRLGTIYILFTIIALIISAIGLFTIALYDTQRRTKEIGIRKVNGATINEVLIMLNKDFIKWVLIAFVIACPIAYYTMHKWLENFAYKTDLSWWVFALVGGFTFILVLLTVSWQTFSAATQNPMKSLRDE